jgi:hypothetical protein
MSPLYLYNGRLLTRDGGLAAASSCCCEPCQYCSPSLSNMYSIYVGTVNAQNGNTGATGSKKNYPSCAGQIQVDIFTGNIPDSIVATDAATGAVLYSSGSVQHGDSSKQPWQVVFGTYTFCKPAGVTNVNVNIVLGGAGGASARVSNCLIGPC